MGDVLSIANVQAADYEKLVACAIPVDRKELETSVVVIDDMSSLGVQWRDESVAFCRWRL